MGFFNSSNSKFNIGNKVFVTTLGLEGTIIDIEGDSYMVEIYGDEMRRFVEVCPENKLRKV